MNSIKPIETRYGDHRFRSRLEARWAVFFDELRISWRYEYEGYEGEHGIRYLPDFYIPNWGIHFEIKHENDTKINLGKLELLASSGAELFLLMGVPSSYLTFHARTRKVPDELRSFVLGASASVDRYYEYGSDLFKRRICVPSNALVTIDAIKGLIKETKYLEWHRALKGPGHTRRWRDMWEALNKTILYHEDSVYLEPCLDVFDSYFNGADIEDATGVAMSARFEHEDRRAK